MGSARFAFQPNKRLCLHVYVQCAGHVGRWLAQPVFILYALGRQKHNMIKTLLFSLLKLRSTMY